MVGSSRNAPPSWMSAASRVDFDGAANVSITGPSSSASPSRRSADFCMSYVERGVSAAGAALLSAILVNPLDVAKTRLQAQAAGVPYAPYQQHVRRHIASLGPNIITIHGASSLRGCTSVRMSCSLCYTSCTGSISDIRWSPSCDRGGVLRGGMICTPNCFEYKGTLDVLNKIIRQEGFSRLWRGTNAALALAIPTVGIYLPCYDIFRNWIEDFAAQNAPTLTPYAPLAAGAVARSLACISCSPIELARTRMQAFKEFGSGANPPGLWKILVGVLSPLHNTRIQSYRILWIGVGAQLSRDVPFSAICWSTLEPIRRRLLGLVGEGGNASSVLGANFAAGFVAGSLAAVLTCPLDVAKTRRQIEKDPTKVLKMTTRETLVEVWRGQGLRGLFTGVGPRVGRAGPSVGIVISFYEAVKHALHGRHSSS